MIDRVERHKLDLSVLQYSAFVRWTFSWSPRFRWFHSVDPTYESFATVRVSICRVDSRSKQHRNYHVQSLVDRRIVFRDHHEKISCRIRYRASKFPCPNAAMACSFCSVSTTDVRQSSRITLHLEASRATAWMKKRNKTKYRISGECQC